VLKKGQIKFTKKAAKIAEIYFKKKEVSEFLIVAPKSEKPEGSKDFYKILFGEKQDSTSLNKVYTKDVIRAKKLFEISLLKESRLSMLTLLSKSCLLYIAKAQESEYEAIKHPDANWPMAVVNENDIGAMIKFISQMKTKAVDLADLVLGIENSGGEV
jgi:hypothetical protein